MTTPPGAASTTSTSQALVAMTSQDRRLLLDSRKRRTHAGTSSRRKSSGRLLRRRRTLKSVRKLLREFTAWSAKNERLTESVRSSLSGLHVAQALNETEEDSCMARVEQAKQDSAELSEEVLNLKSEIAIQQTSMRKQTESLHARKARQEALHKQFNASMAGCGKARKKAAKEYGQFARELKEMREIASPSVRLKIVTQVKRKLTTTPGEAEKLGVRRNSRFYKKWKKSPRAVKEAAVKEGPPRQVKSREELLKEMKSKNDKQNKKDKQNMQDKQTKEKKKKNSFLQSTGVNHHHKHAEEDGATSPWTKEECTAYVQWGARRTTARDKAPGEEDKESDCETDREALQKQYSKSLKEMIKLLVDAKNRMVDQSCERSARDILTSAQAVQIPASSDATFELAIASNSLASMQPALSQADDRLQKLQAIVKGQVSRDCKEAREVSKHLARVRELVMSLEHCPGAEGDLNLEVPPSPKKAED